MARLRLEIDRPAMSRLLVPPTAVNATLFPVTGGVAQLALSLQLLSTALLALVQVDCALAGDPRINGEARTRLEQARKNFARRLARCDSEFTIPPRPLKKTANNLKLS